MTLLPTGYWVCHPDYVRVVRIEPVGPTHTKLHVEWLFARETLDAPGFDMSKIVDFVLEFLGEDGGICEVNQLGLSALPYEEGVRKLVGRWVQRYPQFEADLGAGAKIADVVEDVFLLAFEGYQQRPMDVPLGTWLQGLIDPALKALQQNPDAELENIEMARSARAAVQGPDNL